MSAEAEDLPAEKPKGGKLKKILIVLAGVIVLSGTGAAGGYFAAGYLGTSAVKTEDPNLPKLVAKDGADISTAPVDKVKNAKVRFDQSLYKATYYPIEAPFTSNLKNSDSFAQLSIAVSTYYDERVLENLQEHETAIRSAILMTLAEQSSESLSTQSGKKTLQGLLATAINDVLKEKSGFGGIDNVYFTNFVVQ